MFKSIDPGSNMGWAIWADDQPKFGTFAVGGGQEAPTFSRAKSIARDFIQKGDVVGLEAPLLPPKMSIQSRQVLLGVRAILIGAAYDIGATIIEIEPTKWRSKILGVTMAPKHIGLGETKAKRTSLRRKWIKQRAIDYVAERGWGAVTDDEADALCILEYLRFRMDKDYRPVERAMRGAA